MRSLNFLLETLKKFITESMEIIPKYHLALLLGLIIFLIFGCVTLRFSYPDPDISIENLKESVSFLTALDPARSYSHLDSINKSEDFILHKFTEYGLEPEMQEFTARGNTYKNIIASIGPKEGPRVIVGAHYDVCGEQPGADDNASGVAGLLEIARFAKRFESQLPYRVDFVAYTLEEPPFFRTELMGSYVHAESLYKNKVKVKGMICLEMIGFFTNAQNSQSYPLSIMKLFYPSKGDFIGVVGNYSSFSLVNQVAAHMKNTSVDVKTLKARGSLTGVDFSDHRNYWKFGYHAVMITDTAFYRNPNYHKKTDTIDTLDFLKIREVVKGVCWSLLNIK